MVDPTRTRQLADAIARRRTPGATWPPPAPGGWEHLPVALVDTTFSLQARSSREGEVFPPVRRYAEWAAPLLGMAAGDLLAGIQQAPPRRVHVLGEMIELLDALSTAERIGVFGTRRPASTRPGAPRRADTVLMAAHALSDLGIETRDDFERRYADPEWMGELRRAWLDVPGFGKRSWEYILILCGFPGVKADVHVTRFVTEAVGADRPVTPEEARDLVLAATEKLRFLHPAPAWSPGGVEHFIGRVESGQPPR